MYGETIRVPPWAPTPIWIFYEVPKSLVMVHSFLFSAIIFSLLMALFPSFRQPFVQMTTSFLSGMTGGGCFGKNCGGSRYVCEKPGIHYALTILKLTNPNDFESMTDVCTSSLDLTN